MKKHPSYRIGLGRAFLDRAGLIFTIFILITLFSGGSAIYAEYKTGQLREKVVKPVQKFVSEVAKSFENTDPPQNLTDPNTLIATSSGTIKIETNIKTGSGNNSKTTNTTTTITYPTPKPVQYNSNTKSYERMVQEMNEKAQRDWEEALKKQAEWSEQKKQENQQWFQQQSQQNEAAAKSWYDAEVQKLQQQTEQWKKEHGF